MQKRLKFIIIAFSLLLALIAARTYTLSSSKTAKQSKRQITRGSIYDRHGFILASTKEASTIALAPQEIYDPEQTAEFLATSLNMRPQQILQRLYERKNRYYFYLKRQVDNLKADKIIDFNMPGIYRERESRRQYPGKILLSNVLGFVGRNQTQALAGIERHFNEVLIHTTVQNPHKGSNLQLTIDSLLQYHLEIAMSQAYESSASKRAAAIVMNVKTGAILAMVNLPNFDPNQYYKSTPFERGNWSIRLNYEPGSTVKLFMAGIILAEKAASLSQRFLCTGKLKFYDSLIRCRHKRKVVRHGYLTLSEIIERSCNVGIIKAMRKVKPKRLYHYMKQFGFGKATDILPAGSGETRGYFPALHNWVAATSYYLPIGQGFSVTPIQLLRASSALVNGGKLLRPFIAWRILSSNKNTIMSEQQPAWHKSPFEESINRKIRRMMRKVITTRQGTGRAAHVSSIPIIGKTGTGEKSSAQGYLDKYVVSFLGFFPANKPQYGVLIIFDEPELPHGGGTLAAPVFKKFVHSIHPILASTEKTRFVSPDKLPDRKVQHWKVKKAKLYDFRNLSARDAAQIITNFYGLRVKFRSKGYVYDQYPPPGTSTKKLKQVVLYLSELQ